MRCFHTKKGQSMAEYAILFAIVIGAAIAMQQYVKSRLQGGIRAGADGYITAIATDINFANVNTFEPVRTVDTTSNQSDFLSMTGASTGNRTLNVNAHTASTVTK